MLSEVFFLIQILDQFPFLLYGNVVTFCSIVDQELGFQDKYLFYRFLDDEDEDTPLPSEEEKRESEEELPETILFLAQIGPDALLRMILRKSSVTVITDQRLVIYFAI